MRHLILTILVLTAVPAEATVVLMYHRFDEPQHASTQVDAATFREHMDLIEEGGYTVRPLADLVEAVQAGETLPEGSVVITIDDAYRSVYESAWPILLERGFPFTVFVATDPVDEGLSDFMDWDQMRRMAESGLATFANHSSTHDHLWMRGAKECDASWAARVELDIRQAQARLEEELGDALVEEAFAWPYGEYDATLAKMIRATDRVAFGQQSGAVGLHSPLHALPRYAVTGSYADADDVRLRLASRALPVRDWSPSDPLREESAAPDLVFSVAETDARLGEIACYAGGERMRLEELGAGDGLMRFRALGSGELPVGRSRYNCTAPGTGDDGVTRWYWFSQLWVRPAPGELNCYPPR